MLDELESQGLLRRLPEPYDAPGPVVQQAGRSLICLHSNNYLGLATHPEVIARSCEALRECGAGATGSRLLSGNLSLHARLENELARFKGTEAALLMGSGYSANLAILGALAGPGDLLVCDKLNHASLIDGSRACGATIRTYPHGDLETAAKSLAITLPSGARRFLVTDSVFSMDGDLADLPRLLELAREHQAWLILDEAHSTGVLGRTGRGIFEHFGLSPLDAARGVPGVVQMGTLGKALGGFGAFVACDPETRELLINRARPFIFSTAPPPAIAGAALGALEVLEREPERVERLRSNASYVRRRLTELGVPVPGQDPTPIIPVIVGEARVTVALAEELQRQGILALAVRPPTVPQGTSRIRISVMATHEERDLDRAIEALGQSFPRDSGLLIPSND